MTIRFKRFLEDQQIIQRPDSPDDPLVSVILPTYMLRPVDLNQRAISSVLSQSMSDLEFIIVDDGSIDGLHNLLLEVQAKDPRITIIRHEINCGLHAVRINEGLLLAKGKYIAYMFEDDEWTEDALENLLGTMNESKEPGLVYGAVEWIIDRPDGTREEKTLGAWDYNYSILKNSNQIPNCGVLHPRSLLTEFGLYDPHILARRLCDYDLWLRMGKKVPFYRCDRIVGRVYSGTKHSLTSVAPHDLVITMRQLSIDRNDRLKPENIFDYEVDAIPWATDSDERYGLREDYIIPFWEQYSASLTDEERNEVLLNRSKPNRLLLTKADYSTSIDVTMGNFQKALPSDIQTLVYIEERSLGAIDAEQFDSLILYRTIAQPSLSTAKRVKAAGKTVIYMLDDNMLKFGTDYLAEEFFYLKPDTPGFKRLERELSLADTIVSFSAQITKDCREYNPRVLEFRTTIQHEYIKGAEPLEGGKSSDRRIKFAIITGSARDEEMRVLWPTIEEFTKNHSDEIEFHVWGISPEDYGNLHCRFFHRPFDHSYDSYLYALRKEKFDYVIMPLFDDHDTKKSKNSIKYLEITSAGAVGIYSDSTAYSVVEDGVTGLITADDPDAWMECLERSISLTDVQRRKIHARAKQQILEKHTTGGNLLSYLSLFEAADLHNKLGSNSSPDGRARIAFFFHESIAGGGTIHLMRHALMAKKYGFQPILCFRENQVLEASAEAFADEHDLEIVQLDFFATEYWRSPTQEDYFRSPAIAQWLEDNDVRLVHTIIHMADVALAAWSRGSPLVITNHAYAPPPKDSLDLKPHPSHTAMISVIHSSSQKYTRKWREVLQTPAFCNRAPIGGEYFDWFQDRLPHPIPALPTIVISGTLQVRKGQLKAIHAIRLLRDKGIHVKLIIIGYDELRPDYVAQCQHQITAHNLEDLITIEGFRVSPEEVYKDADFILCASNRESFPQTILKAMASGIRVISTPVGGVTELVRDGFSGVVTDGMEVEDLMEGIERALGISTAQWREMRLNAHKTARMVCTEEIVSNRLLRLYNQAVKQNIHNRGRLEPGNEGTIQRNRSLGAIKQVEIEELSEPISTSDKGVVHFPRRLTDQGLTYTVKANWDAWSGVRIAMATYKQEISGSLLMTVCSMDGRQIIRTTRIDLSAVKDCMPHEVFFDSIENSKGAKFTIKFYSMIDTPNGKLAIYEFPRSRSILGRFVSRFSKQGGLLFGDMLYGYFG
jgi:glycosyltransferase involved in cell wall biosynthesis